MKALKYKPSLKSNACMQSTSKVQHAYTHPCNVHCEPGICLALLPISVAACTEFY